MIHWRFISVLSWAAFVGHLIAGVFFGADNRNETGFLLLIMILACNRADILEIREIVDRRLRKCD